MPSVALATCRAFPGLDDEDRLAIPALAALGITGVPAVWDDPGIDWSAFDAVVLRETWDYVEARDAFLAWLEQVDAVTRMLNPPAVVRWNTDKRYLRVLADAGVPTVPTAFIEPGDGAAGWAPPAGCHDFVVKPAVSAGSRDTVRYATDGDLRAAREHARRLVADGRTVMVQPYLDAVDTEGETALLFLGGEFSHAIRKGALLERGVVGAKVGGLFVQEQIGPRDATPAHMAVAEAALAAVPGGPGVLLYARVDLIPDATGAPMLLELELAEPSLFLSHAPGSADRLARAVAARLGAGRRSP
ncbi:MAG: ATP-grasp domain-containing protein, partial [Candidatus Nanopelagicales bacterium]